MEGTGKRERAEKRADGAYRASRASTVTQGKQELQANLDHLERPESKDRQAPKEPRAHPAKPRISFGSTTDTKEPKETF
jgi:hypothetical protein